MPIVWSGIRCLILSPVRSYFRYFPVRRGKQAVWRHIVCHLRWLESWETTKTVFRKKLRVYPIDDIGRSIYYFGIWEPNLTFWIAHSLSPGDTFVDVGANIGYFSLLAAGIVGERGSVVSIEAMPRTCEVLAENFRLNGIGNGRVVGMAVWDGPGNIEIFGPSEGISGTASALKSRAETWNHRSQVMVPCATLSSILSGEEIRDARIVKIDVEGAEWHVVSGMTELMKRGREDLEIVVELDPQSLRLDSHSCQDVSTLFRRFGFHPYQIENVYGDLFYTSSIAPARPRRIDRIPEGEQSDIIFSRRDVEVL
jgi:FkbM family methyltransferase